MHGARDFVFLGVPGHFKLGDQWKQRLGGKRAVEPLRQPFLGRGVEPVAEEVGNREPPVMEQHLDLARAQVPERGRVAGDALGDPVLAGARGAVRPHAFATFADAEAQPVGARVVVVVTGSAGYVAVARQDLVIEQ